MNSFLEALVVVFLALVSTTAAADVRNIRRRQLVETDLHYGIDDFNKNYNTRAFRRFEEEGHFHRRLFEHESALPHDQLQTYLVKLHPIELGLTPEIMSSLEQRASATIHTVVGDDIMMHGTREHADAMREQPEVHKVVPYIPELKVTPHFEQMLPKQHELHRLPQRNLTELIIRLIPLERHEHLRKPAVELLPAFRAALAKACEGEETQAKWRGRRACAATEGAGRPRMEAEGDRTIVVSRVAQSESLQVADVLAHVPEALWVEPKPMFHNYNADAAAITQSGSTPAGGGTPVGAKPVHLMGLHGEDEIIGVGDSGLDTGHCFFEDKQGGTHAGQQYGTAHRKVVAYRAYADSGAAGTRDHGTHVVGSILGESSTKGAEGATEHGVAYKAHVSFTDIGQGDGGALSVPNDLVTNFFNIDYDHGARLHSNSWGANVNAYTIPTSDVDEFMHQKDDMLILYAAGNSGQDGPGSIGAPATCKNCLTVGASENNEPDANRQDGNIAVFSSQGPSLGRNKPDVVAPGFSVMSSNSNSPGDCPLTSMAGTSMATPVTTGNTALVRQYFREGWFPTGKRGGGPSKTPSGAMLKALMITSGTKLTGKYQDKALSPTLPNDIQGYGRIQLNKILFGPANKNGGKTPFERLFFVDDDQTPIKAGETHTYNIAVSSSSDEILGSEVKITLVWTDPAAEPQAAAPLINNLDLEVVTGGQTLKGNNKLDTTSTVEQVVIPSATAGALTIKVKGTKVPKGPQKYAIVATGSLVVQSPPPAPPRPSPPKPPSAPFGDSLSLGITAPLLGIAVLGAFFYMRQQSGSEEDGATSGPAALSVDQRGLPAPWKEMTADDGRPYYLNAVTGETKWTRPTKDDAVKAASLAASSLAQTNMAPSMPPPPAGWVEMVDEASQRNYYYNTTTGDTQWTMPTQ